MIANGTSIATRPTVACVNETSCDTAPSARPILSVVSGQEKIQSEHLQRLAIVYVRQSTPQQVLKHRESTDLQ